MTGKYVSGTRRAVGNLIKKEFEMNQNGRIRKVKIDSLEGSQFNPPDRINPKRLRELADSIQDNGFWEWNPILLGRDGRVADGHRRLAAAKLAGLEEVPTLQVDMDTAELWTKFNGLRTPVSGMDFAYAYVNGLGEEALDMLQHYRPTLYIKRFLEIGGAELVNYMVANKISPNIYSRVSHVTTYCGEKKNIEFMRLTTVWIIKHKMTGLLHFYMQNNLDPILLRDAILADKPIQIAAVVS